MKALAALSALSVCILACGEDDSEPNASGQLSCASGETEVAGMTDCMVDCAVCYELAAGRWCTGPGTDCVPELEYDGSGCLTSAGASNLCGFSSDSTICTFAATCRTDADVGQCRIDCEMSTTVTCLDTADVECVWNAAGQQDCTALEACSDWVLVY